MEVKTCEKCGTLFRDYKGTSFCSGCELQEEENFQHIKTFLKENPGATAIEVCNATGLTLKHIRHYLDQGRLSVVKTSHEE